MVCSVSYHFGISGVLRICKMLPSNRSSLFTRGKIPNVSFENMSKMWTIKGSKMLFIVQ